MSDLTDGFGRPITKVRAGMPVVDAEGETVGTVAHVTAADRPADGDEALNRPVGRGDAGWAAGVFGADAPDIANGRAARLMSGGYLKVIDAGMDSVNRYVAADELSEVDELAVHLKVNRDELMADQ